MKFEACCAFDLFFTKFKANLAFYPFSSTYLINSMKKVNKQCLLDTPLTVRVSEKTWQVIVPTRRP